MSSLPQPDHTALAPPRGVVTLQFWVLHGESSKRLATPRNTKDKKHLQSTQSAQPTNLTDQAPSTTERTARETHNTKITQQSCTLQHNNNPPSAPTPDRVITRSFQPMQPAAKPRSNTGGLVEQAGWLRRRAEPHNTIDTTRLSGDTQWPPAPPALGGARHQEVPLSEIHSNAGNAIWHSWRQVFLLFVEAFTSGIASMAWILGQTGM